MTKNTSMDALPRLRNLTSAGLRDHDEAWGLAQSVTAGFPKSPHIDKLRHTIADLLHAIEIETILGGPKDVYARQLSALLDWVEKTADARIDQGGGRRRTMARHAGSSFLWRAS